MMQPTRDAWRLLSLIERRCRLKFLDFSSGRLMESIQHLEYLACLEARLESDQCRLAGQ